MMKFLSEESTGYLFFNNV